jgi:hypothetical protein
MITKSVYKIGRTQLWNCVQKRIDNGAVDVLSWKPPASEL